MMIASPMLLSTLSQPGSDDETSGLGTERLRSGRERLRRARAIGARILA